MASVLISVSKALRAMTGVSAAEPGMQGQGNTQVSTVYLPQVFPGIHILTKGNILISCVGCVVTAPARATPRPACLWPHVPAVHHRGAHAAVL